MHFSCYSWSVISCLLVPRQASPPYFHAVSVPSLIVRYTRFKALQSMLPVKLGTGR